MKPILLTAIGVAGLMAQSVEQLRTPHSGQLAEAAVWKLEDHGARKSAEGHVYTIGNPAEDQLRFYREDGDSRTLAVRVRSAGAAALRAHFEDFHLPADAKLYVYGVDGNGSVTRVAGPYVGTGPSESGDFWSLAVPGPDLVVELQLNSEPGNLPFLLREVALLDAIEESAAIAGRGPAETRVSWYRGMRVEHHVVDGYGVWEGDILLGRVEELEPYESGKSGDRQAFAITGAAYRWPSGVVPYTISPSLPNQSRVTDAITHWNTNLTGSLLLVPRTTESEYLSFIPADPSTCSSYVGKIGIAAQPVNIGDYCSTGNIIHEIGHAIGLYHEHTRTDRNTYVTINTQNITPAALSNFTIVGSGTDIGSYDYGSIMHYGAYAFSSNGLTTIDTIPPGISIGQRTGLSAGDIAGVRTIYPDNTTPPGGGTVAITIASNPSGQLILVDGSPVLTPAVVNWATGSPHTVWAQDAAVGSTQYVFASWSDAGAQSHTYNTPAGPATLTATYNIRYHLTKNSSDINKGRITSSPSTADEFYNANSKVIVYAIPTSGNCFMSWGGILPVADFQAQVTMNQPYEVWALFQTGAVSVPTLVTAPAAGGTVSVGISATSGCLWKATGGGSWLTVLTPSGTASGVLRLSVSRNTARTTRSTGVVVNGRTITVTQQASY